MIIRNYVKETDIEECRALMRELTAYHREMYDRPVLGGVYPPNDRDLEIVDPSLVWVAVHDSKVIGLIGLIPHEDENEAEVDPIIVTREFRGKGVGGRLLDTAVAEARARGCRLAFIRHLARNIKTIQFSYKHGFTKVGFVELLMDLSERTRKPGPRIFECDFAM